MLLLFRDNFLISTSKKNNNNNNQRIKWTLHVRFLEEYSWNKSSRIFSLSLSLSVSMQEKIDKKRERERDKHVVNMMIKYADSCFVFFCFLRFSFFFRFAFSSFRAWRIDWWFFSLFLFHVKNNNSSIWMMIFLFLV